MPGKPYVYAGLFLTTLSTLMYEILLPRIFSVTMFYHFAFMAVSIAMFGMTAGAVVVYVRPARYTPERAAADLASNALAFAVTLVASFCIYLEFPPILSMDLGSILLAAATYVIIAVPFVFSGITVAIALTRFPERVASLYAADLGGAALGCLCILYALGHTDAPTAALVVSAIAAFGAALFAFGAGGTRRKALTAAGAAALAAFAVGNHFAAESGHAVVRLKHRVFEAMPRDYEKWNAFSYVEIFPAGPSALVFAGWGMSPAAPTNLVVNQRGVSIDEKAGTSIVRYDGDPKTLEFLRYDVTNAAHQIRKNTDVCVIGVGGGRDILSALYFGQRSVLGIELNGNVLRALTDTFGDYAGHIDRDPRVELVSDEARSYLARTEKQCGILQISLIDTFAATSAGAFVLAENSLYTTDAWDVFLRRLTPAGVLSVSRYYFHRRPAEAYRMVSLAVAALRRNGVTDARRHLLLVKNLVSPLAGGAGIGTLLVSRAPFSTTDVDTLEAYARSMQFDVALAPDHAGDEILATIANGGDLEKFYDDYDIDVSPPVDDRPFFFQMLRPRDVLRPDLWNTSDVNWKNLKAVLVLVSLLAVVVVLTAGCIVVPLALGPERAALRKHAAALSYFTAIGFAFMFVEMAQMQRFVIFLGHPTYALSVVLFTLLLSAGAGSLAAGSVAARLGERAVPAALAVLGGLLVATGFLTPVVTSHFAGASTPLRIALAAGLLAPAGLAMGMPFPLGMRHAAGRSSDVLPWLWGMNGAASVCCSVLATLVSLAYGIGVTFWAGLACYAMAAIAFAADRPDSKPVSAGSYRKFHLR